MMPLRITTLALIVVVILWLFTDLDSAGAATLATMCAIVLTVYLALISTQLGERQKVAAGAPVLRVKAHPFEEVGASRGLNRRTNPEIRNDGAGYATNLRFELDDSRHCI